MNPLLAAWLCWAVIGFSSVVGKYAADVISPALLVFLGCLAALALMSPWLSRNRQWGVLFAREYRRSWWIIGTLGTAVPFTMLLWALHYTTPGNAAILQQTELIYSLLFSAVFLKEKISFKQLLACLLIVGGAVLILLKEKYRAHWVGDLMIIGSVWTLQAASCTAKKLPPHLDPRVITAARSLYALPLLMVLCLFTAAKHTLFLEPGWLLAVVLLYTGLLKYGAAMIWWYRAIGRLPLSKVTAVYLSYPILTLLLSAALGLEKTHAYQWAGLALTLAGAYWISFIIIKEQNK